MRIAALFVVFALGMIPASLTAEPYIAYHRGFTRIAQATHADICKANLDQCEKACDGFQQCIKQCEINYQGCMAQGG